MGFDIYGENGESFHNNVWYWHPLWDYCASVAPRICSKVKHPHTNDGSGLGEKSSLEMARLLREEIAAGRTEKYAVDYRVMMAKLPDENCNCCGGTGILADQRVPPDVAPSATEAPNTPWIEKPKPHLPQAPKKCHVCKGAGKVRPFDTWYPFEVVNVKEFAEFLEKCGGFKIY